MPSPSVGAARASRRAKASIARGAAGLLLAASGFALVGPVASATPSYVPSLPSASCPLSIQGCNTRCQSEQTDCALRCDGDMACIKGCQNVADSCVEKCQAPAPAPARE